MKRFSEAAVFLLLACGNAMGQSSPVPLQSGQYYVLTEGISITTDSGITGLRQGTKLKLVEEKGATVVLTDGTAKYEVDKLKVEITGDDPAPVSPTSANPAKGGGSAAPKVSPATTAAISDQMLFDETLSYAEALGCGFQNRFDEAMEICDKLYRENPGLQGLARYRELVRAIRPYYQHYEALKSQTGSSQNPDARRAVSEAYEQFVAAKEPLETYARGEEKRIYPWIQQKRADAVTNIRHERAEEDKNEAISQQNATRSFILWRICPALLLLGVVWWIKSSRP